MIQSREIKNIVWQVLHFLTTPRLYDQIRGFYNFGYWPNIKNPNTFTEKLLAMKYTQAENDDYVMLADKYAVRQFVEKRVGAQYLNEIYHVGKCADSIPFDTLPNSFVIKTTHDSGGVFIIEDKQKANIEELKLSVQRQLDTPFGKITNEKWYTRIDRKILVEKMLKDPERGIPNDYKFLCFKGKCEFIQVDQNRYTNHTQSFYSPDWVRQEITGFFPGGEAATKPENLKELISIAERLAEGFDFIRVDLYTVEGRVIFGEMTLIPHSGYGPIRPRHVDVAMGQLI